MLLLRLHQPRHYLPTRWKLLALVVAHVPLVGEPLPLIIVISVGFAADQKGGLICESFAFFWSLPVANIYPFDPAPKIMIIVINLDPFL